MSVPSVPVGDWDTLPVYMIEKYPCQAPICIIGIEMSCQAFHSRLSPNMSLLNR